MQHTETFCSEVFYEFFLSWTNVLPALSLGARKDIRSSFEIDVEVYSLVRGNLVTLSLHPFSLILNK